MDSAKLLERLQHDVRFLLACLDMCEEADAPPSELDPLDLAILSDIRRENPQVHPAALKAIANSREVEHGTR